ncbi:cytohesin-interacting protein [Neoarius graeffei]|uniref:cytohesin-interacting protein n=1 Tax=Neoarius graeffei TaxID=443677 RepID=UPI00298C5849|nr:cytohesin-interacting protein [Neoarius graeffei]
MTMSSVMYIKKLLKKSSRAACVSREKPGCTAMMAETKHTTHYSERRIVLILKKDNEAFGFNIRTYEENTTDADLLTCVCSVKANSPAESAGLRTGDAIICVNSICVKGFEHQQIVDLIQKGSSLLKMEIVRGTSVKQKELQKKLEHLQRQLREKRAELKALITQEERLRGGELRCTPPRSCLASEEPTLSSSLLLLQT